jgi:hypothetical protein
MAAFPRLVGLDTQRHRTQFRLMDAMAFDLNATPDDPGKFQLRTTMGLIAAGTSRIFSPMAGGAVGLGREPAPDVTTCHPGAG